MKEIIKTIINKYFKCYHHACQNCNCEQDKNNMVNELNQLIGKK